MRKINIIKGRFLGSNVMSNTVFTLKNLTEDKGKVIAVVDASDLLGKEYSSLSINVEDYKILD